MDKPKIRFKGFEEAWSKKSLGEIASRSSCVLSSKGFPRVEYEDIISEIGVLKNNVYSKTNRKSGLLFQKGDVIFGKLRPYLKNWFLASFEGLAVGDFWVLRPQKHDSKFLYRLIQSRSFSKIANQSTGTKMPRADWQLVSTSKFFVSNTLAEQEKIGNLFERIDTLLNLQQHKCDKLKVIKKAMLSKMFPKPGKKAPEVRFQGFTDDWVECKLGEIAFKVTDKNTNLSFKEILTNSAEYGIIKQSDYFDNEIAKVLNSTNYFILHPDDFVYNPRISVTAPVGPINRNKLNIIGIISPLYTVFRTKDIDKRFLEIFFKSQYWHRFMYFNGDSGARSDRFSIKDNVFFSMPIPYPSLSEQKQIGDFFHKLDSLIHLSESKLSKLRLIKRSLLEDMFV